MDRSEIEGLYAVLDGRYAKREDLETRQNGINELVASVGMLTVKMQTLEATMTEVRTDVKCLTDKPARRWDSIVDKILMLLIAGVVAYVLTKIGLQ